MKFAFGQPYVLLLLVLVPLIYVLGRWRLRWLPSDVRQTAVILRMVIVVLVVLALARPVLGQATQQLSVVFAIDGSTSVSAEGRSQAEAFIQAARAAMRPDDRFGIVAFGESARVVQALGGELPPSFWPTDLPVEQTNIAEALRLARAIFPEHGGKRIVVLSDGQETVGRAEQEAREAALGNIQVVTVPVSPPNRPEVLVEMLDIPPAVRLGESIDVGIVIQSTVETQVRLALSMDDEPLGVRDVPVQVGPNRFSVPVELDERGFHRFYARIEGTNDTLVENNEAFGFTVVKDPGRVLLVTAKPEESAALVETLTGAGVTVDVQPPSAIPSLLTPMKQYDSMVLANVPAQSLSLDQMKTIDGFVKSLGRGLLVVGGDSSFSVGNYGGTPLADVLPVQMNVPGNLERGNVAVLLVIDKSGSMDAREDGVTKIRMARDAAILAIDVLDRNDHVGVTAFDTSSQWIVPVQRVGDAENLRRIQERISRIEASGGTEIFTALNQGYEAMAVTQARYKHIILLTDGRSLSNSDYNPLMQRMRDQRITLSTIAVGSDADLELLQDLSRQGEGRYYFIEHARDIPRITMRETRIATGASAVEGAFRPQIVAPSPILKGIAESELPELTGYVVTSPREGAQVVMTSDRNDPVLAQWYYGLGRVAAFTADASPKWADAWLQWPNFARFWSQALRWSMRSPSDPTMQIGTAIEGRHVNLTVEVVNDEGVFQDLLDLRARVSTGAGDAGIEMPLQQTRPGRYEAEFSVDHPGAYRVEITLHDPQQGGQVTRTEESGFVVPYPAEFRWLGVNRDLLTRVAAVGNGRMITEPFAAFGRDTIFQGTDWYPLWPWLLGLALLLFPLDVGVRRLKLSPGIVWAQAWPVAQTGWHRVRHGAALAPRRAARWVLQSVRRSA